MFGKILIGYQDTEQGRDALELGRVLAQANGAEMLIVTAPGRNGEDLAQLAHAEEADLVVLGSTHRGSVGRIVPGATVGRLLADAPCAVAVAPPGFADRGGAASSWRPLSGDHDDIGMRVVGVGYDGSHAAGEALRIAADLAIPNGAALRVYSVARKYARLPGADEAGHTPGMPSEAEALRQALHEAVAKLPPEARALPVFMRGFAATELIKASMLGVDLLVLGSRTGGPVRRAFQHSVSNAILMEASCPVLISPSGVRARARSLEPLT
ncbi:MAG TPA: universal stress protein [Solirubrobacterales bacterium]|nr:universal stress protein [Solirubrobacterales bacterium]